MQFETLTMTTPDPHIVVLTLNRPLARNAINAAMMAELYRFWSEMSVSSAIYCIILTGEMPAFCAGADLKERQQMTIPKWQAHHAMLRKAFTAMLHCPIPIISAVNGAAVGGGLELILLSDFAYAATDAVFAQPEVKHGIIPGGFGTQYLPKACGRARANELIFTGKTFSAADALTFGIINHIYPLKDLLAETIRVAKTIAHNAPLAIREAKKAIANGLELECYQRVLLTKDRVEGITAFNEKRPPHFKGE